MECRNKPQSANSHEQHQSSLPQVKVGVVATIRHRNPFGLNASWQATLQPKNREEPCNKARKSHSQGIVGSRNSTYIPKHESCRVADNRKCTTAICRKHNGTSEDDTLPLSAHNGVHYGKHHNGGRKVVEICRNQESDYRQGPKHPLAATCTEHLRDEVEASVVLQYLYYCHCREQEENNLRSSTDVFQEKVLENILLYRCRSGRRSVKKRSVFLGVLTHYKV